MRTTKAERERNKKPEKQELMELITLFMSQMNTRMDRLDASMAELKAKVALLKAEVASMEKRLILVEGRLEEQSRIIASLIPVTIAAVPGKTAPPPRTLEAVKAVGSGRGER